MPLSPEARRALESLNRKPLRQQDPAPSPPDAPAEGDDAPGRPDDAAAGPASGIAPAHTSGGRATPPAGEGAAARPAPPPSRFRPGTARLGSGWAAPPPSVGVSAPEIPPGEAPLLERLVPGGPAECRGRACFVHRRVVQTPSWRDVPIAHQVLDAFGRGAPDPDHPMAALLSGDPERMLFLDIESCGLSGGPLFLVGVLFIEDGMLHARQFFARDYTEEPGVLEHTRDLIAARPWLVTFNGKTFDLPYIANRCIYHRIAPPEAPRHLDLLHLSRKRWRRRLPDCRLQTLERHVCRRHRIDDIPGELMAQAYHDFVRTADASQMRKVFHHNLMDLVTMAEVLCALAPD